MDNKASFIFQNPNWTDGCGYDTCGSLGISLMPYDGHQSMTPFGGTPPLRAFSIGPVKTPRFTIPLPAVPGAPSPIAPLPCNPPARQNATGVYFEVGRGDFTISSIGFSEVPYEVTPKEPPAEEPSGFVTCG